MAYAADSSSHSSHDEVAVSLGELKARLRVLHDERSHVLQLSTTARQAFETHRIELTQLQQKERAVFMANEDRLRDELHRVLAANRSLMEAVESRRAERDRALRDELLLLRRDSCTQHAELQEELDELWRQRYALDSDLLRTAHEQDDAESSLTAELRTQQALHESLQSMKQQLQDELDEDAERTTTASLLPLSSSSTAALHSAAYASTPLQRIFVPSGPTPVRRRQSASPRRRRSRATGSPDDLAALGGRAAPPPLAPPPELDGLAGGTHHVQALLSTIERSNWLRPRAYLRRHGRDHSPAAHSSPGEPRSGSEAADADEAQLLCGRLQDMRRQQRAHRGAMSDGEPPLAAPPPLLPAHREESLGVQHGARGGRSRSPHFAWRDAAGGTVPAPVAPAAPSGRAGGRSGRAVGAACDAVLAELQSLRDDYVDCQQRLRDPAADSVDASQEMRRLLSIMDRKADQLRVLRSQQRRAQPALRANDVLQEVLRENKYCEGILKDIIGLTHSS